MVNYQKESVSFRESSSLTFVFCCCKADFFSGTEEVFLTNSFFDGKNTFVQCTVVFATLKPFSLFMWQKKSNLSHLIIPLTSSKRLFSLSLSKHPFFRQINHYKEACVPPKYHDFFKAISETAMFDEYVRSKVVGSFRNVEILENKKGLMLIHRKKSRSSSWAKNSAKSSISGKSGSGGGGCPLSLPSMPARDGLHHDVIRKGSLDWQYRGRRRAMGSKTSASF